MRILHTSDWRIGQNYDGLPADLTAVLARQRVATVGQVAALAAAERVDAVVVAGGVFAEAIVDAQTEQSLAAEMDAYKGPWVVLPDSGLPPLTARAAAWLENASRPSNVFPARAGELLQLAEGRLAVIPFAEHASDDAVLATLRSAERAMRSGAVAVGLAHRPSIDALGNELGRLRLLNDDLDLPLDYLALGGRTAARAVTPTIRYSGSHEDSPDEGLTGHCLLVDLSRGGMSRATERTTTHYTWSKLPLLLHGPADVELVDDALGMLAHPRRHLVRLQLAGMLEAADAERLAELVSRWRSKFYSLDVDLSALIVDPSPEDRAALSVARLIADTTERLEMIRDDLTHPDRHTAAAALQRLYDRYIRPRE